MQSKSASRLAVTPVTRRRKERRRMKRLNRLLAIPGMFFLVIVLLITSFQLVIYGDPSYGFYEKEYEKYHVTASLHMSMEDVMEVTEHMMDYLIGKEEKLSIVTDVDGCEQDFFNEQDRLHMADVKNLFLGGLKLRSVFLMLAIVLLMLAGVKAGRKRISRQFFEAYSIALGVFLGLLLFLGVAFAIDFTACFTVFHEIFFTNDLWLFDPSVDYMIRMLPEGFFSDMVLRIGAVFVGMLIFVWMILYVWKKHDINKYKL